MLPKTLESVRESAIKWKEAGLWIKANSTGIPRIVSKDCRVAFYAEGKGVSSGEKDCYIVTADNAPGMLGDTTSAVLAPPLFMGRASVDPKDRTLTNEDNSLLKKIYHTSRGLNIYYAGN